MLCRQDDACTSSPAQEQTGSGGAVTLRGESGKNNSNWNFNIRKHCLPTALMSRFIYKQSSPGCVKWQEVRGPHGCQRRLLIVNAVWVSWHELNCLTTGRSLRSWCAVDWLNWLKQRQESISISRIRRRLKTSPWTFVVLSRLFSGMTQSTVTKPGKFTLKDGKVLRVFLRDECKCLFFMSAFFLSNAFNGRRSLRHILTHCCCRHRTSVLCPLSVTRCVHTTPFYSCFMQVCEFGPSFQKYSSARTERRTVGVFCRHWNNYADGVSTMKFFFSSPLIHFLSSYLRTTLVVWYNTSVTCTLLWLQVDAVLFIFVGG